MSVVAFPRGADRERLRLALRPHRQEHPDHGVLPAYSKRPPILQVAMRAPFQVRSTLHGVAQRWHPQDHGWCRRRVEAAREQGG